MFQLLACSPGFANEFVLPPKYLPELEIIFYVFFIFYVLVFPNSIFYVFGGPYIFKT